MLNLLGQKMIVMKKMIKFLNGTKLYREKIVSIVYIYIAIYSYYPLKTTC